MVFGTTSETLPLLHFTAWLLGIVLWHVLVGILAEFVDPWLREFILSTRNTLHLHALLAKVIECPALQQGYNPGQIVFPKKTKNPILHFYKISCIFADFDARRKPLDKGTLLY